MVCDQPQHAFASINKLHAQTCFIRVCLSQSIPIACFPKSGSHFCCRMLYWFTMLAQFTQRDSRVPVRIVVSTRSRHRLPHAEPLLPPLLAHTSLSEAHFHLLAPSQPSFLHSHTDAPFTSSAHARGLNFTLYLSPDCRVASLNLRVDWWGTLGRAGARYWTAAPGWAVGVVAWMLFTALGVYESGGKDRCRYSHGQTDARIESSDAERVGNALPLHVGDFTLTHGCHIHRITASTI